MSTTKERAAKSFVRVDLPCDGHTFENSTEDRKIAFAMERTKCHVCGLHVYEDILSRMHMLSDFQTKDHNVLNKIATKCKNGEGRFDHNSYDLAKNALSEMTVGIVKASLTVFRLFSALAEKHGAVGIRECYKKSTPDKMVCEITRVMTNALSTAPSPADWNKKADTVEQQ
ncbi:hypothetical protein Pcinc_000604 [Petrolisthes cinctipes]|uniref:Uncharacterized protein n=1 Tax=Petrolisthes cinctipes TaxID=88211 RepID=A0AAE1GPH2_PETCI|nr:hypothetical protein Pcinc_000604 [Petrolisthes cinctipes]